MEGEVTGTINSLQLLQEIFMTQSKRTLKCRIRIKTISTRMPILQIKVEQIVQVVRILIILGEKHSM